MDLQLSLPLDLELPTLHEVRKKRRMTDKEVFDTIFEALTPENTDKTPSDDDGEQPVRVPSWNDDDGIAEAV